MGYDLGVDLGTTYTAAAVLRDGRTEIVTLGTRSLEVPSVAFLLEDGEVLVGEPAERRSLLQPDRFAREFKRRIGDPTPILLGGTPFSAHALTARLLRAVVALVSSREGGPPDRIVVTCPASWSDYKRDLLEQAIRQADVGPARVATEPEAAAVHYASTTRVAAGDVVAVYDLGGGTFDATVLRNAGDRFEMVGEPQGLEHLGGVQFDDAVFAHVTRQFQAELEQLDPNHPATLTALARLRRECVEAKEALSADTEVTIPVALPNRQTEVRLTRPEFEAMIRPALADTIETMERTLRSADLRPADVTAVLLVGGSSRIPLIAELVASELRRPTAVDVHPKHAVAMGAALLAGGGLAALPGPRGEPVPAPAPPEPEPAAPVPEPEPTPPSPVPEPQPLEPQPQPQPPVPEPGPVEPRPPVPEPVPPGPPVPEPEPAPPVPEPEPVEPVPPSPVPEPVPAIGDEGGDRDGGDRGDGDGGDRGGPDRRPRRLLVAAGVVTVVAVVGALTQLGGGDDGGSGGSTATTGSCAAAERVDGGGELLDLAIFDAGVPEHIDPAQVVTAQSWQLVNALYDGLTEVDSRDPENPQVVPQVAGSIGSNQEATRWRFTIREGLRFSNGEPVLPSSFVRGWERASDPDLGGQHAAIFSLIEGGEEKAAGTADTISGLTADDEEMTLEVELAAPHAAFDAVVGFQPFMPMPEAVERLDDQRTWEDGEMVGNGPFVMEAPRTADEVRVVRNPEWNGTCYGASLGLPAQPALERITFRAAEDGYGSFTGGAGDVARVPPRFLDEAQEAYGTTLDSPPTLTYYLTIDWQDPVLGGPENRLLRQAISQAVDRDYINSRSFMSTSTPATGMTTPAIPGFAAGLCEHCSFDLAAAQESYQQWQAEGHALTEPIRFQSIAQPGESDPAVASVVENLEEIGIPADEEELGEDYTRVRSEGECQICMVTVFPAFLSYDSSLYDNFHSESIGRDNFGRFSDPTFDDLVDEGRATVNVDDRIEVFHRAEQRLVNELVGTIPILWSAPPFAHSDRIEGFTVNQLGQIVWERVSVSG